MLIINSKLIIRFFNIRLASFKKHIYTYLFSVNRVDFNNLAILQVELLLISAGYYLVDIGVKIYPALQYLL